MTRTSKQEQRRAVSPRRRRIPGVKTGPKKDNLAKGFREHSNVVEGDLSNTVFVPTVRSI